MEDTRPAEPAVVPPKRAQTREERQAREAAALRANLLKRKQQTRQREKPEAG